MKTFITSLLVLAATVTSVQTTQASDQAVAANPSCTVALGNATGVGSGWRASGGTAVIRCALDQEIGQSLTQVYARIKPALATGPRPFCNIQSYNAYSTLDDISYRFASSTANNQSLSLPIPDIYNAGYTVVACVLNVNDIFYGYRYRQS